LKKTDNIVGTLLTGSQKQKNGSDDKDVSVNQVSKSDESTIKRKHSENKIDNCDSKIQRDNETISSPVTDEDGSSHVASQQNLKKTDNRTLLTGSQKQKNGSDDKDVSVN
jgi:hypothetical protein